jgi:hypothetical protein
MIHVDLNEAEGVAVIRPEQMHGLSEADFKELKDLIDDYLRDHDTLHGLVIAAKSFPGWEDFKAFTSHIRFIRDHHRAIRKVALVSDSRLLSAAPYLVYHSPTSHLCCRTSKTPGSGFLDWREAVGVAA